MSETAQVVWPALANAANFGGCSHVCGLRVAVNGFAAYGTRLDYVQLDDSQRT